MLSNWHFHSQQSGECKINDFNYVLLQKHNKVSQPPEPFIKNLLVSKIYRSLKFFNENKFDACYILKIFSVYPKVAVNWLILNGTFSPKRVFLHFLIIGFVERHLCICCSDIYHFMKNFILSVSKIIFIYSCQKMSFL